MDATPPSASAAESFAQMAVELHASDGVENTVESAIQFAVQALGCRYAGVALARAGHLEVPAVTEPVLAEIYRFQLDGGLGALVECMRHRSTVLVRDTVLDGRWPEWAGKMLGLGIRSVLDVPLSTDDTTVVGVLGLYSTEPDAFTPADEEIAHIFARHASVALRAARREADLHLAVDSRHLVGQAVGILMERYDLDANRAFEVLRRYSQDTNTKLREVARQLIAERRLPTPPDSAES
ncbi:GAF and ANTAR domain-containing protein [Kribbella sp. NPDC004875]|uniref:GAF and ANTAR domain-containing protein n=1 Tax=Kribbella sp. NPDC004875 TaxID=3364107 RepID=UPI00369B5139